MKYPLVLASSVIRSTFHGESHGGIYLVDLNNKKHEKKVDWNDPNIDWSGHGGDRGCRGLTIYQDKLYCSSAKEILVFDKQFNLVDRFTHPLINGTHEIYQDDGKLYTISNQYDCVLVFDLQTNQCIEGYQYKKGSGRILKFDPNTTQLEQSDSLHLDMVYIENNFLYIGGSQFGYLLGFNLADNSKIDCAPLVKPSHFGGSHNLRRWNGGLIYCLSDENEICFQRNGELEKSWRMPPTNNAYKSVHGCFSKAGYTRGMVAGKDFIICGSSPAKVAIFDLDHDEAVSVVEIEQDIRYSICGMTEYKW